MPYVPRRFWRDWSAAIHARYPAFRIVGEVLDSDPALPSFFQGGRTKFDGIDTGLDSVFGGIKSSSVGHRKEDSSGGVRASRSRTGPQIGPV